MSSPRDEVTRMLVGASPRERVDQLLPLLHDELRELARRKMAKEPDGHTLQPTALVHEACVRLLDSGVNPNDRAHFRALLARAMRRVLIDHARRRRAEQRGGDWDRTWIEPDHLASASTEPTDVLDLEDALQGLTAVHAQAAEVVEMRCFGGMEIREIATALGVHANTVGNYWKAGLLWLKDRLGGGQLPATEA